MASHDDARPSASLPAAQPLGHARVPEGLRELLGERIDREIYLNTEQAAQLVGRPSRAAFIQWARRQDPPIPLRRAKGTRTLVVKKGDLDFALRAK